MVDAEGWSQTATTKELGVPRETVTVWLKNGHPQVDDIHQSEPKGDDHLSVKTRYHVANCRLEDFQP